MQNMHLLVSYESFFTLIRWKIQQASRVNRFIALWRNKKIHSKQTNKAEKMEKKYNKASPQLHELITLIILPLGENAQAKNPCTQSQIGAF